MPTLHVASSDAAISAVARALPAGWTEGDDAPAAVLASVDQAERFLPGRTPWADAALIVVGRGVEDLDGLLALRASGADAWFATAPTSAALAGALAPHAGPVLAAAEVAAAAPGALAQRAHHFLRRDLSGTLRLTMDVFVDALQARDPYTYGHANRVALSAVVFGLALGHTRKQLERLAIASMLHDIGKIGISDDVLRKPSRLDPGELAEMKTHPTIGAEMIARYPSLRVAAQAVLQHHEHWDGSGYPYRVAGLAATRDARIIGLVDAVDSITSDRPYRQGRPADVALAEVARCAGRQFDPDLARDFLALHARGAFPPDLDWLGATR